MLESLCGKTKGHRDRWPSRSNTGNGNTANEGVRHSNQHQHQSLDDLPSDQKSTSSTPTDQSSSLDVSTRRLRDASSSPRPHPQQSHSQLWHQCDNLDTQFGGSRPFSKCPPKSITIDNLQRRSLSTTIVMTSLDDSLATVSKNQTSTRLPRSKTASIPEHVSSSTLTITRQNAVTSEFASLSPTFSASSTRPLRLTFSQKQALQNTWRIIKDNCADRMSERIFQKMINTQPKVKDVFYKAAFLTIFSRSNSITTYRDHARLLVRMFNEMVTNVDRCENALKEVRECGMKHVFLRQSGFKADVWERFGEAAVEVINEQDCVKSNLEAVKAWTILIASITDEMRHGYETEARRRSYTIERPKSACE